MRVPRTILLSGLVAMLAVLVVGCTAQSEDAPASGEAAAASDSGGLFDWLSGGETITVPAGTQLTFVLGETISTETSESGDSFRATLSQPVVVDERQVIPSGAEAMGRISEAVESGRVRGRASIQLTMEEIENGGERYALSTDTYHAVAQANTGDDAAKIGVGAGIGAAVGAILGGGEGAAKGAAIGGGGATAVVLSTKGDDIEIPAGTPITFVLDKAIDVSL